MVHRHDDDTVTTPEVAQSQGITTNQVRKNIRAGIYPRAYLCQECAPNATGLWRIPRTDLVSERQEPLFDLDSLTDR